MITSVRSASVHDGKLFDAITFAVKIAKYMREKFSLNTQVSRNVGGPIYQLHWITTYPSLADFEKTGRQVEADEGYRSLLAELRQQNLLIGTSVTDSLYENIG
jgi:hypothetical protein